MIDQAALDRAVMRAWATAHAWDVAITQEFIGAGGKIERRHLINIEAVEKIRPEIVAEYHRQRSA